MKTLVCRGQLTSAVAYVVGARHHAVSAAVGGVCNPASADDTNNEMLRFRYIVKRLSHAAEALVGGKASACGQIHVHALRAVVEGAGATPVL